MKIFFNFTNSNDEILLPLASGASKSHLQRLERMVKRVKNLIGKSLADQLLTLSIRRGFLQPFTLSVSKPNTFSLEVCAELVESSSFLLFSNSVQIRFLQKVNELHENRLLGDLDMSLHFSCFFKKALETPCSLCSTYCVWGSKNGHLFILD